MIARQEAEPGGMRPRPHRVAGRAVPAPLLMALIVAAASILGCAHVAPLAPYPTQVVVPYPSRIDPALGWEDIHELYAVSPLLDPDGLGILDSAWENSFFTLVSWEYVRRIEERNKIAYARNEEEQQTVLAEKRLFYTQQVVFDGVLLGDALPLLQMKFYGPEGIYLVDDRGQKFRPVSTEDLDPILAPFEVGEFGTAFHNYARIVFPGEALNPETRSLTLYLARFQKRMSFTWIFDPSYEAEGRTNVTRRRAFRK